MDTAPTHYLHHQFRRDEDGRWVQVWRLLPAKQNDLSASQEGDRRETLEAPAPQVGETVARAFPTSHFVVPFGAIAGISGAKVLSAHHSEEAATRAAREMSGRGVVQAGALPAGAIWRA